MLIECKTLYNPRVHSRNIPQHHTIHLCTTRETGKRTLQSQAFDGYYLLLVITCDQTNFTIAVPLRDRQTQTVAEALIYRVIYLFSLPRLIVCDEATEFTSAIVQAIFTMLNCRLKVISPYNHGSSKCERQIKTISEIIVKHLWDKDKCDHYLLPLQLML